MKKKTDSQTVDPMSEELAALSATLSEVATLKADESKLDAFLASARETVDAYALSGDLDDQKALAAIVVKRLQAELAAARVAKVNQTLEAVDARLAEQVESTRRLVLGALFQIRNGLVERAAREMEKHFPTIGDARRQAFLSTSVTQQNERIHAVQHDHMNSESGERAANYLKIGPAAAQEVEELEQKLGGTIPSEGELRAI